MAQNVYVTALEAGSGKSAVVLGLTEVLSQRAGRLGFFRPLVASADQPDADLELVLGRFRLPQEYAQSYALTEDDLNAVTDRADYNRLIGRVLTGYNTVADGGAMPHEPIVGDTPMATADAAVTAAVEVGGPPDLVVIEGSDFTSSSFAVELDLNVDAANTLAAPVLLVVRGRHRTVEQVLDAVGQGIGTLRDRGCTLIGAVANRLDPETVEGVRAGLSGVVGDLVGAAVPEAPSLAAPTVAEVALALQATYLQPVGGPDGVVDGGAHREVGRLIVGAMGLEHFLERMADADLVITPADRADIVAGSLAAHLSGTYPAVAGLVLTGGQVPAAVIRLVEGYGDAGIPVIAVDGDTYSVTSAVAAVRGAITTRSPRKMAAPRAVRGHTWTPPRWLERIVAGPAQPRHPADVRVRADRAGPGGPPAHRAARGHRRAHPAGRRAAPPRCGRPDPARRPSARRGPAPRSSGSTLRGRTIVDPRPRRSASDLRRDVHELRAHKGVDARAWPTTDGAT